MKVTKFAVALLSMSSLVAPAVLAQSVSASALVPADVRRQPFLYPCPTYPRPTPDFSKHPSTDCGDRGPIVEPHRPIDIDVPPKHYLVSAVRQTEEISAALDRGDNAAVSAKLDGFFSGSSAKQGSRGGFATGADAVVVVRGVDSGSSGLQAAAPQRLMTAMSGDRVRAPLLRRVDCGDNNGCRSETGKVVEDATRPVWNAIDRLGNALRDRNDQKLKEATEQQKRVEQQVKNRQRPTV